MTLDARTELLGVLYNQPIMFSDAIVSLSGQDGEERLAFASALMRQNGAQFLVISGGVDSESQQSAKTLFGKALSFGIAHDRIILEEESTNTREQAVNVVKIAEEKSWRRIILVASGFHLPRAFLTFVQAVNEAGLSEKLQILPLAANQVPWFGKPRGCERTRRQLYAGEFAKIALYGNHVATYEEGIAHMEYWEGK